MARKRINCNAICSSDNYKVSRKAHLAMLKENHDAFVLSQYAKDVERDIQQNKENICLTPARVKAIYKEVRVFGTWDKLSKYFDVIQELINGKFQFR